MKFRRLVLIFCLGIWSGITSGGEAGRVLEAKRWHLGQVGQWEWEAYRDRPVDAGRFEIRFDGGKNAAEQTLRIWQRDVKLGWPVSLNGRKLGVLVTAETAMETLFAVPPGLLRDGENVLTVEPPSALDDVEVGPVTLMGLPVSDYLRQASLGISVTDAASGKALPCRITVTRSMDGALQPLSAGPEGEVAVRSGVVYTKAGQATLGLPPGKYRIQAGRGFEWSVAQCEVSLTGGASAPLKMELSREVPTEGWIAADSHIHTLTHSGHGDALIAERMLTIAGEGIELAIATDHNHHTDFAPEAAAAGVARHFTPVVGNEVTTKHGHFNAFPIKAGAAVVDSSPETWSELLPLIRAVPGVEVITLNHPRDLHSGFVPLGGLQFNAKTGEHRQAAALDIDAMEVVTSAAMQSDIHRLYRDWFALLNRGHRIAAIASSDSHDVNRFILGQGRTYVAAADGDPGNLDLAGVWRSYREGRLLVSLGLLAQVKVDGRFGVGDLATGLGPVLTVEATVSGPSWVRADHVALYGNGVLLREEALRDDFTPGEKARVVWKIPRPEHDLNLVVIATGPGVTAPFWEIPRPYQPDSKTFLPRVIGSTNPVWIDADGDGQYQSALTTAPGLQKQCGGDDAKWEAALRNCDDAIRIQADVVRGRSRP